MRRMLYSPAPLQGHRRVGRREDLSRVREVTRKAFPARVRSASWSRSSWANAEITVSLALLMRPVVTIPSVCERK